MPKKIHFIVEGQTEAVFVRHLLELLYTGKIKIVTVSLGKGYNLSSHQKVHGVECHEPEYQVTIVDAVGEGGVIPVAQKYGPGFIESGSENVLCLRDMYCQEYSEATGSKVINRVTSDFVERYNKTMRRIDSSGKTELFFAVMEIEAWFLAMNSTLRKMDNIFTEQLLKEKAGIPNEQALDVEKIYRPSKVLSKLYDTVGKKYDKSVNCAESIVAKIESKDVQELIDADRSESFVKFHEAVAGVA